MANTVAIDIKINALEAASTLKDLRANLKDAVNELAGLESGTAEFNRLANAVDDAKDRIEKLNADIEQVGAAGKFGALADMGSKIAAGFEVAQGAMALFGSESEEVEKALQKVQGAMALAQGAKELSEFGKSFNQLKTIAVNAFNGMSAASKAFALTGIGLLITAIAALAANWDTIKEKLGLVNEKQAALNATLEDYKKGAQGAIEKTTEVKNAFELAREGVISKEEALEKYNSTLGDSFGKANDLNEAERLYESKTKAYVEATAKRQQAQALLQKAAEAQVKALTAGMEDERKWYEKTGDVIQGIVSRAVDYSTAGMTNLSKKTDEIAQKNIDFATLRAKVEETAKAKRLGDLALSVQKEAELLEKNNKIVSEDEKKANDKKIANRIAANNKQADLQAELNRILAGLRNENLDDERQRAKDKEK